MKIIKKLWLVWLLVIMVTGCATDVKDVDEEDDSKDKVEIYLISRETAVKSDGEVLYTIKYKYDRKGNEKERTAYNGSGEVDAQWLEFAYDNSEFLADYLHIDVSEDEDFGGRYFQMTDDYEFEYNLRGDLIQIWLYDDNEWDIAEITYSYTSKKVSIEDAKQLEGIDISEGENIENGEDVSMEVEQLTLEEKINNGNGIINVDGEMCYALWGETAALVWKYVEATFEEDGYYASALAFDMSQVYMQDPERGASWDASRVMNWHKWYDFEEFPVEHIGDDMFQLQGEYYGYKYCYYINPYSNLTFEEGSLLENEDDYFYRRTGFGDGYAVCEYIYTSYGEDEGRVALLSKKGNLKISEIETVSYISIEESFGKYSDGVFFYDEVFYDSDFNEVLTIYDKGWGRAYVKQGVYEPYFSDGVCTLITYKNDKYWIFDINKTGEVLTEVKEFDLSLLDY